MAGDGRNRAPARTTPSQTAILESEAVDLEARAIDGNPCQIGSANGEHDTAIEEPLPLPVTRSGLPVAVTRRFSPPAVPTTTNGMYAADLSAKSGSCRAVPCNGAATVQYHCMDTARN